ncbi:MAG: hypothetical protein KDB03_03805 [Planctomycetales bacterium]|nr:hypothetical protein [Planctomycetales bacterium]
MTLRQNSLVLAPSIRHGLSSIRDTLRFYVWTYGLLLIACWVMFIFWAGALVDYVPVQFGAYESPRWVRVGCLSLMGLGAVWFFIGSIVLRLWRTISDSSLALLIERHNSQFENELITAVELAKRSQSDASNPDAHAAMLIRAHDIAAEKIGRVEVGELFNWRPLWSAGVVLGLGLVLTSGVAISAPPWFAHWSARLFKLSDVPWPRSAELRADGIQIQLPAFTGQVTAERSLLPFVDGHVNVSIGGTAVLHVAANTKAQRTPEICTLFYQSDDGGRGRANLRRVGAPRDNWQSFTLDGPPLDGIVGDITLSVIGLDARIRDLRIQAVPPPVITQLQIYCQYPDYLRDSFSSRPAEEHLAYRSGLLIPEGTTVWLEGEASQALSSVQYVQRGEDEHSEFQVLSVAPEDNRFRIPLSTLNTSQVVEVRLLDRSGLASELITRYVVAVQKDTIPELSTQLDGIGLAITPHASLPIQGTVKDDHGLAELRVELVGGDSEITALPIPIPGDEHFDFALDLAALSETGQFSVQTGTNLALMLSAQDHFDLSTEPHVGHSQAHQLSIVTVDQLLVILERQELELRQRLELIISELYQLREAIQSLGASFDSRVSMEQQVLFVSLPTVAQPEANKDDREDAQRLANLRAQQCVLQADKSEQELSSVAARVDNLRRQLVNNRIDSYDRQERLAARIHDPLRTLLSHDYVELEDRLIAMQAETLKRQGRESVGPALVSLDKVLVQLEAIKANMLDIASFNEIVDLVRGLLEDQQQLLDATEKQRKQGIFDFLQ